MKRRVQGRKIKELEKLEKQLHVSVTDMRKIITDFHSEMQKGLAGRPGSLKMIPTYFARPSGNEKGRFIALDLGGTNFRVLKLELKGGGRTSVPRAEKFTVKSRYMRGSARDFFDFIAGCVGSFLKRYHMEEKGRFALGFTFSFPVKQSGPAAGRLVCWTKGFRVKGVIGKNVVELLDDALVRKGIRSVKIVALVNDTVGTLAAKSYEEPSCDVGVIIGTGTNACYPEAIANIKNWKGMPAKGREMIINTEWGNFNRLKTTRFDDALDASSHNGGEQILEKMVSGLYLGEIARLVMADMARKGLIADKRGALKNRGVFNSECISAVEKDTSKGLVRTRRILGDIGLRDTTREDRALVKSVCRIVSLRAARISASAIAAVVTKMDPGLSARHVVAVDGSVYEKNPIFSREMGRAMRDLFGGKASRIRTMLAKDGSGKGAAVIAAVASSVII